MTIIIPQRKANPTSCASLLLCSLPLLLKFLNPLPLFMEDFRSKSCRDGRMQLESYYGGRPTPSSMQDLRSYSTSYASSAQPPQIAKELKIKKGKSSFGSSSKSWSFNDPELQRKKRVASYKVYAVEGKMKGSLRKSFRWIKDTYTQVVYGWW